MKVEQSCKVSIIIPNYNGIRYIKGCLDSLTRQSFQNFKIIIVDNASQDGSSEFILEEYPEVRLISLKQNHGFSKAVNEGIKASNCEYVVLLNNDTEAEELWLENLVKCIESDEKIFSCCSKMIRYNEKNKIDDAGDEYTILGWSYKRGDGISVRKYDKNKRVFSSCAGAAIYRRRIFDKIGYFEESFFAYMEDVDISYRANIYGYKNMYCCDALVYHIGSATSGSRHNAFKVKLASRNNVYVILKNMPLFQLILNFPFLVLGFIIKYIYFVKKGLGKEYKSGIIEAIKNRKQINRIKVEAKNLKNYSKVQIMIITNTLKLLMGYK